MTADEFRQMGLPGLYPLMILIQDGANRDIAEEILTEFEEVGRIDSLPRRMF
jgi:hypothetical protein